jgi:hypothetical protein
MVGKSEESENIEPKKLSLDDPSNFQFHAAYLAYSELFEKSNKSEIKKQLNETIIALKENKQTYSNFYRSINKFREERTRPLSYNRSIIKTQRKRDYRKNKQKSERIRRHKK